MPYVTVKLFRGYQQPLTYQIPPHWLSENLLGAVVRVPVRNKIEQALIIAVHEQNPLPSAVIPREIIALEPLPPDEYFVTFVDQVSKYYMTDVLIFYKRLRWCINSAEKDDTFVVPEQMAFPALISLTEEQQRVVTALSPVLMAPSYQPAVLQGVTGSGKTYVYYSLIEKTIAAGRSVIFLVPDVSLAVQFTHIFRSLLTSAVFGFHSATSMSEKRALWQRLLRSEPTVIVGVHLPMLLPIAHLGLIIIDEEHDLGFQEKQQPRFNTKEIAFLRAQTYGIPLILGSATPSLNTLYNMQQRNWPRFFLKQRYAGAFPRITIVPLLKEKKREFFWISTVLHKQIADRLAKKEQVILFLNRRGYSFFMQCNQCSFIFSCDSCSVSFTLHEQDRLICHYCGYSMQVTASCPQCSAQSFIKKGIGTQQIVNIVQKLFPDARMGRADLDATVNKKKWQATLTAFKNNEIDILVGTQTITKGYHFPRVTLVGVIWADSNLHLPLYHAAETTVQQLLQVAGRAGRNKQESNVVIQTMGTHPLFSYIDESLYQTFCDYEMAHRQKLGYPPYVRFACIELRCGDEDTVEQEAQQGFSFLDDYNRKHNLKVTLLGPAPPLIYKIKNTYIRVIFIKGANAYHFSLLYEALKKHTFKSALFFIQNPLH
jgi:primosomal protein N' (replication factor Y) (superfamily II helicase)